MGLKAPSLAEGLIPGRPKGKLTGMLARSRGRHAFIVQGQVLLYHRQSTQRQRWK